MFRYFVQMLLILTLVFSASSVYAGNPITIFGTLGPHVALLRVAEAFCKKTGIQVNVIFGPQSKWDSDVLHKADILYSASDNQMLAFIEQYKSKFNNANAQALYLHKAIILVQQGNPKKITGIHSLLKPSTRIIVNDGLGISHTSGTAVWEDIVGRLRSIEKYNKFRKNIAFFASNSSLARAKFIDPEEAIDAWITWEDWASSNELGTKVKIEDELAIYRPFIITPSNSASKEVHQFIAFLTSRKAKAIFAQHGWYEN